MLWIFPLKAMQFKYDSGDGSNYMTYITCASLKNLHQKQQYLKELILLIDCKVLQSCSSSAFTFSDAE